MTSTIFWSECSYTNIIISFCQRLLPKSWNTTAMQLHYLTTQTVMTYFEDLRIVSLIYLKQNISWINFEDEQLSSYWTSRLYNFKDKHHITRIICEPYIWWFTLKCYWRNFILAFLSTLWKEIHDYGLNSVHLIWRSLHNSPNHQINHRQILWLYGTLEVL